MSSVCWWWSSWTSARRRGRRTPSTTTTRTSVRTWLCSGLSSRLQSKGDNSITYKVLFLHRIDNTLFTDFLDDDTILLEKNEDRDRLLGSLCEDVTSWASIFATSQDEAKKWDDFRSDMYAYADANLMQVNVYIRSWCLKLKVHFPMNIFLCYLLHSIHSCLKGSKCSNALSLFRDNIFHKNKIK